MSTKNFTIKLTNVFQLESELTTLLTEPTISFGTKYDLVKILDLVKPIVVRASTQRLGIYQKYGSLVEGSEDAYQLDNSPERAKALKELEVLFDKNEIISCDSIKLSELADIKSANPYQIIFTFVTKE